MVGSSLILRVSFTIGLLLHRAVWAEDAPILSNSNPSCRGPLQNLGGSDTRLDQSRTQWVRLSEYNPLLTQGDLRLRVARFPARQAPTVMTSQNLMYMVGSSRISTIPEKASNFLRPLNRFEHDPKFWKSDAPRDENAVQLSRHPDWTVLDFFPIPNSTRLISATPKGLYFWDFREDPRRDLGDSPSAKSGQPYPGNLLNFVPTSKILSLWHPFNLWERRRITGLDVLIDLNDTVAAFGQAAPEARGWGLIEVAFSDGSFSVVKARASMFSGFLTRLYGSTPHFQDRRALGSHYRKMELPGSVVEPSEGPRHLLPPGSSAVDGPENHPMP